MIPTIIILLGAFYWLALETDFMRVRLLRGKVANTPAKVDALELKTKPLETASNNNLPPVLLLTEVSEFTKIQKMFADTKYKDSWRYGTSYNTRRPDSYQQMTIGNHRITLVATLYNLYDLIVDVNKAQTEKPRKPSFTPCRLSEDAFIKQVRVGSRREWVETDDKGHGYHKIVEEYNTHYKDCLAPKGWLEKHEHDTYTEPTIEITIDGKSLSINGNYKQGVIGDFMGEYTYKARAGKKTITAMKGQQVVNCGGGVYIAQ